MVNVSENYQKLALNAGRRVYCKILIGETTIGDDKLLEFDFDDIVHPDWVTFGTACANRFAFSIRYESEIGVNAEVKPFISFDGEEWCPLGVFFVERRYIRGNYASIICYDKMYSLDAEYTSSLSAPTTTSALLREICSNFGIICRDYGSDFKVEKIPETCTVRDMIGYIAGMYKCCAKFDRNGELCFKRYHVLTEFFLESSNCMVYNRNMDYSIIKRITVDTGEEFLESGDGGVLSTIELYNPLYTQEHLDLVCTQIKALRYYGAEIELPGLPFLESGDYILLMEQNAYLYMIALSEIKYHYDGALTAKLSSRNRSDSDPTVHKNDLEAALEDLRATLGNIYKKQINEAAITLSTAETTAAEFSFEAKKPNVFAQVDMNFTVEGGGSNTLLATVYVNGDKVRESVHTVNGSARELIHFYYLAENLRRGKNTITVTLKTASGQMTIQSGQLIATLVGKGMAGGAQSVRDRQTIFDSMPVAKMSYGGFKILALTENMQTE